MKKILIRTICILLIIATVSPSVFAEEGSAIQPRYTYTRLLVAEIDVNNTVATCSATLRTYDQYDLKLICQLQQKIGGQWKPFSTWSVENSNSRYVVSERTCNILSGGEYRFVVYGYVYSGDSLLETTYKYSS